MEKGFVSPLLLKDDEILALGVKECDVEIFRRMKYQASFGVSTFYSKLKDKTFSFGGCGDCGERVGGQGD